MKKTMIFAAFAALLSLASCQKNEPAGIGQESNIGADNSSPVFTAIINPGTKTTVDVTDGKVSWEASDEITVTDAASNSAVYVIESIDSATGKATFVTKDGQPALGDGPYSAVYGTPPAKEQIYSATAGRLYMAAPATSDNSFTFTVQCGLMKLNLTKAGVSVKSISVTGTPTGGSETTYTLTCNPAKSISSAKDFFIALPDGRYNKIDITNVSDSKCTLNSAFGISVAANHIKPVTFDGSKLSFAALPLYALPGKFSVAEGKQVHFACGNLYAKKSSFMGVTSWTWRIYDNQYDCNSLNSGESRTATDDDAEIDLFTWGYDYIYSLLPTGSDYPTDFTDWGSNIVGAVWRTPTIEEWQYLFTGRSNASNLYKCGVTVCEKQNCIIIAPDYWDVTTCPLQDEYGDSSSPMTWAEAQEAGLVCLPAAGVRVGSYVKNVGDDGYYWSSSTEDINDNAYGILFNHSYIFVYYERFSSKNLGNSVRLVTEIK